MTASSYDPASHYDRITEAWRLLLGDELHYGVFERADEDLATATGRLTGLMADAAALESGAELLDVGCGTGAQACLLAADHGVRVTGITTSGVGVDAGAARASSLGLGPDRVSFERRDGMDNGFGDRSFDRVWSLESSHLMRRRDRFVAECARVLRRGGRLVLCDISLRRPMPFGEVRRLREPLSLLREVFGDARMEPPSVYAELIAENGLTVDFERDLTAATRPTFTRWRDNAARHRDEILRLTDQVYLGRFLDACDVLEGFWDDGTLGYFILAARRR